MQARGPLMMGHRLIEPMLAIIQNGLTHIESKRRVDPLFVDAVVAFIGRYAHNTRRKQNDKRPG